MCHAILILFVVIGACGGRSKSKSENTAPLCSDGIDNDTDGYVDCGDQDCLKFAICMGCGSFPRHDLAQLTRERCRRAQSFGVAVEGGTPL